MSYDITETYVDTVCFTKYIIEKSSKKDRTGCMEKITKNCDKPVFFLWYTSSWNELNIILNI